MSKFNKAFQVVKTGDNAEATFTLSGPIIEISLFPIQEAEGVEHLILDLKEVTLINSGGIRLWLQWMTGIKLLSPTVIITVVNAPKIMIDQMNYFRDFIPAPYVVKSLFVPYFCESCNLSHEELLLRNEHFSELMDTADLKLPEVTCPNCKQPMEMDIFPEQYFKFLKNIREGLGKI
ncbi:MAG: hypothetical protein AB7K41_16590 [Bdellovibrionales bacterium]